jgi:hypothetical protein
VPNYEFSCEDHWLAATARLQPEALPHLGGLVSGPDSAPVLLAHLHLLRVIRDQGPKKIHN